MCYEYLLLRHNTVTKELPEYFPFILFSVYEQTLQTHIGSIAASLLFINGYLMF